ncbi:hypothetical protein, partial [Klebsiella pneumoniae]|uniref:hypothetical protein n=1 Tax=Klebsiella pneumoniae TaxID=573 RepID=UPI001953F8DB
MADFVNKKLTIDPHHGLGIRGAYHGFCSHAAGAAFLRRLRGSHRRWHDDGSDVTTHSALSST